MQIASFEKRVFAYIIDFGLCLTASILFYIFVCQNIFMWHSIFSLVVCPVVSSFLFILLGFLVYFTNGVTLGNAIFKLKMVSIKFQKLSLRQVMVKYLPLSLIPCVIINAIYMLVKHTEKTIFDNLSHTVSVSME